MKNPILYLSLVIATLLMVGCQTAESAPTGTPPMPTRESTLMTAPTATNSNVPQETPFKSQCLTVAPTLSDEITANGTLILSSPPTADNGGYKPGSYLFDMTTEKISFFNESNGRYLYVISPDRTLIAYVNIILNNQREITKQELVITNLSGKLLKVLPWKKEWSWEILGWLDNQRLLILLNQEHGDQKPYTLLAFNPFSGEQQLLLPDFPKFLDTPRSKLVSYNQALTRAIYPRYIGDDQEMYTYALWDVSNQKLVASLENIFSTYSSLNDTFPNLYWSPDGLQFVFSGLVQVWEPDGKSYDVVRELYQVGSDGQVTQLTHLAPYATMRDSLSWSPNGRYLAGFLVTPDTPDQQALVTLIDTSTFDVINYCIPVYYGGRRPILPIWSPDGKQFLISELDENDHWHVILVDIEKGLAAQLATDRLELVAWMAQEP